MDRKLFDVVVLGGGISGLTAAWCLKKAGVSVRLIEAGRTVGGCTQTQQRDGFLLEKGPFNVVVRDPTFEDLLDDLSSDVRVITADRDAGNPAERQSGQVGREPLEEGIPHLLPLGSPSFGQPRPRPPDPPPHVRPKPGGGARLAWLLLVKPDGTGGEPC